MKTSYELIEPEDEYDKTMKALATLGEESKESTLLDIMIKELLEDMDRSILRTFRDNIYDATT
jgi:hypothetical protein